MILYRFLDTVGDGSGTKLVNGDYSSTLTKFLIKPTAPEVFYLTRMIVSLTDNGNITPLTYGALATLSNGISVKYKLDGVTTDFTNGVTIKSNGDWGRYCYDVTLNSLGPGNDGFVFVRWTFEKSLLKVKDGGSQTAALKLEGHKDDEFYIEVNDDLRGLISHYFMVEGETHP
jgi:hypothetical protein